MDDFDLTIGTEFPKDPKEDALFIKEDEPGDQKLYKCKRGMWHPYIIDQHNNVGQEHLISHLQITSLLRDSSEIFKDLNKRLCNLEKHVSEIYGDVKKNSLVVDNLLNSVKDTPDEEKK